MRCTLVVFFMTRTIFFNSSIRWFLFCKRPAVSAIRISTPQDFAAWIASKITEAESAPVCWAITGYGYVAPHFAAVLLRRPGKVSPAASITDLPCAWNSLASLPMVVVLPTPFTPTIRMTYGVLLLSICRLTDRLQNGCHLLLQQIACFSIFQLMQFGLFGQALHDALRGFYPKSAVSSCVSSSSNRSSSSFFAAEQRHEAGTESIHGYASDL